MASGHEFLILRRFGEQNVLVLLHLQNQISVLDKRLKENDQLFEQHLNVLNQRRDCLTIPTGQTNTYMTNRNSILDQMQALQHKYNKYLLTYAQVRRLPPAHKSHLESLRNWHHNYQHAIDIAERYDLDHDYDLVCVTHQPNSLLVNVVEKLPFLQWLFRKKRRPGHTFDVESRAWSHKKMHALSEVLTLASGLGMLLEPMWLLSRTSSLDSKLAIISGFAAAFVMLLMIISGGRPLEVLAATAAYSAVLVVFIQQISS